MYVKSAKASTDVPTTVSGVTFSVTRVVEFEGLAIQVPEFISQRRRWLNGSLFASIHATVFFYRIWTSGHGFFRKLFLQVCAFDRRLRHDC
jgi:chitin synthase